MDPMFFETLYNELHEGLVTLVNLSVVLLEFIGVGVIVVAALQGICNYVRRDPLTRLKLAKGMAMGLEFKLGSEILRTVVVREFTEIGLVAAIIVLRAALTFLIHWEIKTEESQMEQELERRQAEIQGRIHPGNAARGVDFFGHLLGVLLVVVGNDHLGALLGKQLGRGLAHTGRAARDDSDLALHHFFHDYTPFLVLSRRLQQIRLFVARNHVSVSGGLL